VSRAACLFCGTKLQQPATGRPPDYCRKACRRAAEYEKARVQRHLIGLEDALRQWRQWPGSEQHQASVQAEIDAATARLLVLLGAEPEPVSPASEPGPG